MTAMTTRTYEYLCHVAAQPLDGEPCSLRTQEVAVRMAVDAFIYGDTEVPGSDHLGVFRLADRALAHLHDDPGALAALLAADEARATPTPPLPN